MNRRALTLWLARLAFGDVARIRTWRKLEAQMRYSLELVHSLEMLRDRAKARRSPLALTFSTILERMTDGRGFADALAGLVPAEELLLLKSGEDGGDFSRTLPLCVKLVEAKRRIVGSLVRALAYPVLLVVILIGLVLVLALHAMPQVAMMIDPSLLTGAAAAMHALSEFIASPLGALLGAGALLILLSSLATLPFWTGLLRLRADSLPPWSIYRLIIGSVWLFTTAILMKANVQLNKILEMQLAGDALSPWLRERVQAIHTEVAVGKGLGAALADCGFRFPDDDMVEDLCVYSKLPGFEKQLYSMAQQWLDDGVESISRQAQALNVCCLLAIIAIICGLGLSIGSLVQQLSTGGF